MLPALSNKAKVRAWVYEGSLTVEHQAVPLSTYEVERHKTVAHQQPGEAKDHGKMEIWHVDGEEE